MNKKNLILVLAAAGLLASCGGSGTSAATSGVSVAPASSDSSAASEPSAASSETSTHTHTWSDEWTSDETGHWHAPTCGDTDEKKDFAAHTFGDDRACTVCGYHEAERVEMDFDAAVAKVKAAKDNDELVGSYVEDYSYVSNWNQAVYMSLEVKDSETGEVYNMAEYDYWGKSSEAIAVTKDKVFYEDYAYWEGDGTSAPSYTDATLGGHTISEAYYAEDGNIVTFEKDAKTGESCLTSVWGQAYCDWWDMTYGRYSDRYKGMYTMESFDESYFAAGYGQNTSAATYLYYYETFYDDMDYDDPDASESTEPIDYSQYITTSVDAWSDYTIASVSVVEPAYDTLFNYCSLGEDGNGYADAKDANLDVTHTLTVKFDTETGIVTSYDFTETYTIATNPNTGKALAEPYVCYTYSDVYYDMAAEEDAFAGEKIEMTAADEAMYGYYGIWYESADVYWFITVTNGYPGVYYVDHSYYVSKPTQVIVDGFSGANPPYMDGSCVRFTGAKSFVVDHDAETDTDIKSKYDYVMVINANGDLNVLCSRNDNGAIVSAKTYMSAAHYAASQEGEGE